MRDSARGSGADRERAGVEVSRVSARRRRWSAEEKARIVRESFGSGKRVEDVAVRLGLTRSCGRLRAVVTGTEVNDSRWKGIFLGDRRWGSAQRVVVDPRLLDPQGLESARFAMPLGAHRAPRRGRATFEFVRAQVPQRGVQAPGVVQPHDTMPTVPGFRTTGRCTTHGTLGPGRRSESIGSFGTQRGQSPAVRR